MQRNVAGTHLGLSLGFWRHLSIPSNFLYSRQYNDIAQSALLQRISKPHMKPLQRCGNPLQRNRLCKDWQWMLHRVKLQEIYPGEETAQRQKAQVEVAVLSFSQQTGEKAQVSLNLLLRALGAWHNINFQGSRQIRREACSPGRALWVTLKGSCCWRSGRKVLCSGGTTSVPGRSHTSKLRNAFSHFSFRNLIFRVFS